MVKCHLILHVGPANKEWQRDEDGFDGDGKPSFREEYFSHL